MFAEDRFRFLMDAARMRDLTVELEGVYQCEEGAVATVARTVMFDGDAREINREPWLQGTRLRVRGALAAQLKRGFWGDPRGADVSVCGPDNGWREIGSLMIGGVRDSGVRDAGNRAIARLLVADAIGLEVTQHHLRDSVDALAREAALKAAAEQRERPSAALEFVRRQPAVLLDPDWFEVGPDEESFLARWGPAPGKDAVELSRELYRSSLAQLTGEAAALADESLNEEAYIRAVSPAFPGRVPALPLEDRLRVEDDCGRLVFTNLDSVEGEVYEMRVGQSIENDEDLAAFNAAWESARDMRLADFLGVPQPNLAAVGLTREDVGARAPARETGVKEIRAGDRVVSAWCADQRDLVSSDGQDAVEYAACDDDVLEAERRALERRGDDADMDGIADGAEVDADHDGLPDVWALER